MKACVIDWETKDPYLRKFGSGSTFAYHYEGIDFKLLGCGVVSDGYERYFDFVNDRNAKTKLVDVIQQYNIWVMHNASYDLGCLKYLYREEITYPGIHDTMLLAKLLDQQLDEKIKFSRAPYSLEALARYFKCKSLKESDIVHEFAWSTGMYQTAYKLKTGRNCNTKPSAAVLDNWCKANLDLFPTEIVGEYCLGDCRATFELYEKLLKLLGDINNLDEISDLIKLCLKMKFRGLKLDLVAARDLSKEWLDIAEEAENTVYACLGWPENFNINSGKQLGEAFVRDGYNIPLTASGNYSITKEWLEEQPNEIFKQLKRYRKAKKSEKDFVQKILDYQLAIPEQYRDDKVGVMYASLKPLGATATGRFTSGGGQHCKELNVLAISSHDEEFGAPIRKLFLPDQPDEKIVCCDFSNQEPRLQVHYASLLGCTGVEDIVKLWNDEPSMKYHKTVAAMTGLEYDVAKMVTLGLAYDMRAFGLSKKLNVSFERATAIIKQYFELLPFMKQLQAITANNLLRLGYIKTIGGRKLTIDLPYEFNGRMRTQERKGMSKLIQGSGADQIIRAMIAADKAGLKVLLSVHDEIIISTNQPNLDMNQLQWFMNTAYILKVPVLAEGGVGNNWGDAKP